MENKYDILIVGASFSGLTLAHHLPHNLKTLVIDQKTRLDAAIESTGLITEATKKLFESFIDVDTFIPNRITTIGVVSPDYNKYFFSHTDSPWIYSTDTPNLVKAMSLHLPRNVNLSLATGLVSYSIEPTDEYPIKATLRENGKEIKVEAKFLVGADGSYSKVAALHPKLSKNKRFLLGFEKVFYGEIDLGDHSESTIYHFWFGEFSLGYGGWLSPTIINGKKAFRVGLAKLEKDKQDIKKLDTFIEVLQAKKIITIEPETKCLVSFGHPIPLGGALKNYSDNHVLLIGDAAGFCGAFAADGIKGSLVSGMAAAEIIPQYLAGNKDILSTLYKNVEQRSGLMKYYKKQLLYRWLWDKMKSDRTFHAMYDIIAREKEGFLYQFCDSKDTRKSLVRMVLKPRHTFHLMKYGLFVLFDMIFKR